METKPEVSHANPKRMPCPLNEFLEHMTGDMKSMDETWHRWLQPKWDKERKAWELKMKAQQ